MRVHVVLGTGAIGRATMHELRNRGESVRMVNRSGHMAELPDGVEVVAADLYDANQVRAITTDACTVYQTAQPAYHQWVERFPPLQRAIIEGMTGSNATLVLVENMYMYGIASAPLTEATPHHAHTRKGRVRSEISQAAFAAYQAGRVRVTSVRGSDYFGPWGLTSNVMGERTFYPLIDGKSAQLIGNVDVPHTHTYIPDFARALVTVATSDIAAGQVWHAPNDRPTITQREMLTMIARELGVEPRFQAMGRTMMRIAGWFIPAAHETVEMMYEFEQPFVVDSRHFETIFGMRATPMSEAIAHTVAWYKTHAHIK
jgi:nucleoside-diphosphate-sugar epimerase